MTRIFDFDGPNLDRGFVNLRTADHPVERELHELIERMWERYEPYADPDFRHGFARDVDGRFWEMYLGYTLLDAGRSLLPVSERLREGGQPDLCVLTDEGRIWIEAIAPDEGDPGPDQIIRPVPMNEGGGLSAAPIRQAQLRTTSAFWTKFRRVRHYLREGVIGENDIRIIAISASRFGVYSHTSIAVVAHPYSVRTAFLCGDADAARHRQCTNGRGTPHCGSSSLKFRFLSFPLIRSVQSYGSHLNIVRCTTGKMCSLRLGDPVPSVARKTVEIKLGREFS